MPTEIQKLAANPWADFVVACKFSPRDASEEPVPLYVTDAPSLFTRPDDDPANVAHLHVQLGGFSTERSLSEAGTFDGPTTYARGSIFLDNSDGRLTSWLAYKWSRAEVEIKLGARKRADGSPFLYADFEPVFVGFATDAKAAGRDRIEIILGGSSIDVDESASDERYRCFGGAALFEGTSATATATSSAALDMTSVGSVEFFGRVLSTPTQTAALFYRGTVGDVNYGIATDDALRLGAIIGTATVWADGYTIPLDEQISLAWTVGADLLVHFYAGRDGRDYTEVATASVPDPPQPGNGDLILGEYDGAGVDLELWEIRAWSTQRTFDELLLNVDGPLADPPNVAGCIFCYKFPTTDGLDSPGEISGTPDISFSDVEWLASDEGDDPELFDGSGPLGMQKADGWGFCRQVPLVCVDTPFVRYQFGRAASVDIRRLRVNGSPMVPNESVVATTGTEFGFAGEQIILDPIDGAALSLHRFIPRQTSPERTGQLVEVVGSTSDDGIYECVAVAADGKSMRLDHTFAAGVSAGTEIRTPADEWQFETDLARSIAILRSHPQGELTADVVLRNSGAMTVSDLFDTLLDAPVDTTDLEFDPRIGAYSLPGADPIKFRALLDLAARSAFAYWLEKRDGSGFALRTWKPPAGNPVLEIRETSIRTIEEIHRQPPYRKISVGWQRYWKTLDPGSVAPSVPAGERKRFGEPFAIESFSSAEIRRDWPLSIDRPLAETLINWRRDALTWLDYGRKLFMTPRRWLRLAVDGAMPVTLDLGSEIRVYHSDPALEIAGGRDAIVHTLKGSSATGTVQLVLFY